MANAEGDEEEEGDGEETETPPPVFDRGEDLELERLPSPPCLADAGAPFAGAGA
jgi:hypothetical protein